MATWTATKDSKKEAPQHPILVQIDKNHFLQKVGDPIWTQVLAIYHDMSYMYKVWKVSEQPTLIAKSMFDGKPITYELLTQSDEIRTAL